MTSSHTNQHTARQKRQLGLSPNLAHKIAQRMTLAVAISIVFIIATLVMAGGVSAATTVANLTQISTNPAANSPSKAPLLFANAITGTVFRDYDSDGVRDELRAAIPNVAAAVIEPGVGGITVSAYNTSNGLITSTTTAADGTYSLDIAANNSVRIEFTGIPNHLQPGVAGTDSGTSVTFINVGTSGTTQVNLGVINPSQYCNLNPDIAIPCFTYGDQAGNLDVVISFGYASGADTPNESPATGLDNIVNLGHLAIESQVGSTYGVAYHRHTKKLFAASFIKRFSGLGPSGPGAIYQLDPTGINPPTLFMDLAAAPYNLTVGTDPHPVDRTDNTPCGGPPGSVGPQGCYFHDPDTFAEVGKISLADMDTTEDDQTLYVVNLAGHELVQIPIGINAIAPPAVTTYPLPVHPDCAAGTVDNMRAGGLGILDGLVYTGIVCSANNSQDASKLTGYIYQFNPGTLNFTQVLSIPFNYTRGCINHEGNSATCDTLMDKDWRPWDDTPDHGEPLSSGDGFGRVYPQPWIMGIEFDQGNMIIGVRDRNGDQLGYAGRVGDFNSNALIEGDAGGDILRACGNPNTGWILENDGTCGPITTAGSTANEGIGGGEYYHGDSHWNHRETTFGGIAIIPSQPDLISAVFDPWDDVGPPAPPEQFYDQGILWFNNQTGDKDRALRILDGTASSNAGGINIDGFGKSNGLGDIVAICDAAPLEIGNRVWFDDDGDGIQAPDETPLPGVEVALYLAGSPIATATTDATGQYFFIDNNHPSAGTVGNNYGIAPTLAISTNYEIRLDLTQPTVSALNLTTSNANGDGSNDNKADLHDSDGIQVGNSAIITFATGLAGHNNHTLDFGFFGAGVNVNIEKYDDPKVVTPGQTLGYTVRFSIVGTDPVSTITVTDQLPDGVYDFKHIDAAIVVSSTLTLEGAAAFSVPTVAGNGVTYVGNYTSPLPSGTVGYITYTVVVSDNVSTITPLDNLVQITIPQSETTLVDNVFTETTPLAAIDLEKATNGIDADNDTGPYVAVGDSVTWTYRVMNTGSIPLTDVFVEDVDFLNNTVVVTPTTPITLAVGEVMTFTFQGVASITGQYTNTATVTGTATSSGPDAFGNTITTTFPLTDTDPSHYFAYVPDISLEKHTNGTDADTLAEAPLIPTGDEVVWTYLITNTGNITLTSLTLNDDKLGNLGCINGPLPDPFLAGATFTCIATGTAVIGPYTNTAVITGFGILPAPGGTGNITLTEPVTDTDPSHYISADVNIDLEKYTNGFNADNSPGPFITANNPVTWTYGITNVGAITLTDITLNDDQEGLISSCPQTMLAPGEAMTCIQTGIAILGSYENNAIVTATPTITWPTVITDADPSHYFNQTLQLGNQVWFDLNNDGQINAGETGLSDVMVNLLDENGNVVNTLLTNASGFYTFTNLSPATYTVEIDAGNFSPTGVLSTYVSSSVNELNGPNGDQDDNGVHAINGGIQSNPIALTFGNQPTGEPEENGNVPDADSNLTIDFGFFQPMRLGNQIWADVNNNGLIDSGENGLPTIAVNLLDSGGNMLTSTTTDASGFYTFTNLLPGTYIVEVASANFAATGVLSTYTSSTPNEINGPDGDRDDNGVNEVNGGIQSNPIVLSVGQEPTNEAEEDGLIADGSSNLTVDFGFSELLSLGNQIWNDIDNDGQLDPDEMGIPNVVIELLDSLGNPVLDPLTNQPITTTTDSTGNYLFTGLISGTYIISVPAQNFQPNGPMAHYLSSSVTETDPNADVNNNDNGIDDPNPASNGIQTGPVQLSVGNEPTNDGDTNANSNLSVDLGFHQPLGLGNQVWLDVNNNGLIDAGEANIPNVIVNLLDENGNTITTTTTNASGIYAFTNLISGTYIVEIDPTNFTPTGVLSTYISSTVDEQNGLGGDNDDNGVSLVNGGVQSNLIMLTPGQQPAGEDGEDGSILDTNNNLTIDFGFFEPLQIGNQVWLDEDDDGQVNNGETGLTGVIVNLLDENGTRLDTTVTNADGIYTFTNLISGTYIVEIAPTNFIAGGTLVNHTSSSVDEAAGVDGDNDDNGVNEVNGGVQSNPVTLSYGDEPTGEAGNGGSVIDSNSNLTIDFGFNTPSALAEPLQLGNQIWLDSDNNGLFDAGEAGLSQVVVNLLDGNGTPVIDPNTNTPISTITDPNGVYTFTNLISGTYIVEIAPTNFTVTGVLSNYVSSSHDAVHGVDGDNDDNGVNEVNGGIQSNPVTLTPGQEPTGESGENGPIADHNSNLTIDFGFTQLVRLGNVVWEDDNRNGLLDGNELGIPGVTLCLLDGNGSPVLDANGQPICTVTNASGEYLFSDLFPGDYIVSIKATNFAPNGPLSMMASSQPTEADPNTNVDNNDNGIDHFAPTTHGIQSDIVTLEVQTEPVGENGEGACTCPDDNSNLTVDFGFVQALNIGNLIWFDYGNPSSPSLANNSDADQGEPGGAGIMLELIKDGNVIATTTTDANGNYFFNVIDPGTYQVCVVAANFQPGGMLEGHISSSLHTDPDDNINNDDNGIDEGEPAISGVCSEPITIGYGEEPTDDGRDDTTGNVIPTTTNTNFTIDFGFYGPPTAISLLSFTANSQNGTIRLTWQTAIEVDNFGFKLLRSSTGDLADAQEIAFISGQGQGTGSGAEYIYIDTTVSYGQNYTYWLVDVDVSGIETVHIYEPVYTSVNAFTAGTVKIYIPIVAR